MQASTLPLIVVGPGLTVRCLTGEGFTCPSLPFAIQVMGRLGSLLPTLGKSHHGLAV
jgi:hypothetical protein